MNGEVMKKPKKLWLDEYCDTSISMRFPSKKKKKLEKIAAKEGISLSGWCKQKLLEAAG
jgi:predicted HicB family RNase H-like nuclease